MVYRLLGWALMLVGAVWGMFGLIVIGDAVPRAQNDAVLGMTFLFVALMFFIPSLVVFGLGLIAAKKN